MPERSTLRGAFWFDADAQIAGALVQIAKPVMDARPWRPSKTRQI